VKDLISAIKNRDSSALARISGGGKVVTEADISSAPDHVKQAVNELFLRLSAIFSGMQAKLKDDSMATQMRRQWLMALMEAGVTSTEQISAGLRMARQHTSSFEPSPGQFIKWCQSEQMRAAGLPDADEVMIEFRRYCNHRTEHESAEVYPWPTAVFYWVITDMRTQMNQRNLNDAELKKLAGSLLNGWASKISSGGAVPEPVARLPNHIRPPTVADEFGIKPQQDSLQRVMEMRRKARDTK
jgi:hypothetical protein